MDILALEIPLRRECLEISEPLIEEEAGRSPDFIADKQVRRGRELLGYGHCYPYISFYFLCFILVDNSFDSHEKKITLLPVRW
jgi:hypothetical protein